MSMTSKGNRGESLARGYLEGLGYLFVLGQYRIRGGEIDLIMLHNEEFVFVEVKLRSSKQYGSGLESIGLGKQSYLRRAAQQFMLQKGHRQTWRIDVVTVDSTGSEPIFEHLKSAIGD